MVVVMV